MGKDKQRVKKGFKGLLQELAATLSGHVSTKDQQWTVKGFIDVFRNVYTISADTKIVSKVLEIHLLPVLLKFAEEHNFKIVLAKHQNYYPDLSFISAEDDTIKFAVDLKTTYRSLDKPGFCNGFTLGSHGSYFVKRYVKKNIQFPYSNYIGHFCLGIIYTRTDPGDTDETKVYPVTALHSIVSVIKDIQFFACEKWEIASDSQGSGNTANIGSIVHIEDILQGNGVFKNLGEKWFDEYWMNYGKIIITTPTGEQKKITRLREFLEFKGLDPDLANPCIRTSAKGGGSGEE
ncbi:MAG TPA: type II restriction endonuclease [bacterium]|nr:type II restriction endonuclease [bacterium]